MASENIIEQDPIKRVGRYDSYYDARTFAYALRKTSRPKKINSRSKYALVVQRNIDERGRYDSTDVYIKSTPLCQVLLEINEGVEALELTSSEPHASPELLFHSYQGLLDRLEVEKAKVPCDENLVSDIAVAIHLVDEDQGHKMADFQKQSAQGEISFALLWALFTPNALVYNRDEFTEQDRILIVRSVDYRMRRDRSRYLAVTCDILHNDGTSFGYARDYLEIDEFPGIYPITTLVVYPLKYHPDMDGVYKRAVELGTRYVAMGEHNFHEVSGQAMRDSRKIDDNDDDDDDDSPKKYREKFYTSGRVMISPLAFHRFQPNSTYNPTVHRSVSKETMTEDQYAMCTPVALGFSFDKKSWGGFAMSRLRDIVWNDDAFQALVLEEKQKTLIHSLVRQHVSQEGSGFDDVIEGKGRGLIGLLVGTPGCGKTLTAEAVAETTRRPLYMVSVGELGTTPDLVESRLLRILELAQMWRAVVLLDEAEVFLQRRTMADINRNALVSIFLRQLEYYQGILILTTNMPEQFDHAFESRIHFSVYYPELDHASRKAIWATFFKLRSIDVSDEELEALAVHSINGRQIKNTFSSAQRIALANGSPKLTIKEINVVLGVLHDWQVATGKKSTLSV